MTPTPRVMLLIDADNVSSDVIEQAAQRTMAVYGAIHVRRAYCNAETALKQQALFKRLSVRPMVNISAGKNSTDIALAVDAIDLVIAERPHVVVLVSSDSDFAPLVIRLREKGCRVCGIGQQGKTGEETIGVYDEFIDLAHKSASSATTRVAPAAAPRAAAAPRQPARKAASNRSAAKFSDEASQADELPVARATSPAPNAQSTPVAPRAPAAPRKTASRSAARKNAPVKVSAPSEAAEFILNAAPALRSGTDVPLNDVAKALRTAGLLGKHGSSLKLFDKLTDEFVVLQHPDRIRWTGGPTR
ncbi:NYN domain-containing protein [Variovorax sp. LG9.2]|jgi:uncharacterized protein (TIGR00288 family)|uniref:NYN domain-containing protein n=1 Tax=Variovorax sp. LG9.2 TaxID=3048626 RepID=UPI002B230E16|nr:NYN domain-containing protein [Variovorax sp. LG9.2]MEB0055470.1 NYN domain-containing protein [Variovorax sp. LG9.2]